MQINYGAVLTLLAIVSMPLISCGQAPQLAITINPNVELLSILEGLASDQSGAFLKTPYSEQHNSFVEALGNSKSRELLKTLRLSGTSTSDLYRWIVQLGKFPDLDSPTNIPPLNSHNPSLATTFYTSIKDDAKKLNLAEAIANQKTSFDTAIAGVNVAGDWSRLLAETNGFFGANTSDYRLYVSGLGFNNLNAFANSTGASQFNAVTLPIGTLSIESNPYFETRYAMTIAATGFAQNHLSRSFGSAKDRMNKHFVWYEYVQDDLHYLPVSNWNDAIRESLAAVTAVTILEKFDQWSSSALKRNTLAEFPWTKTLFTIAGRYAQSNTTDRNTDMYVKQLLDELDTLRPVLTGGEPVDLGLDDVGLTDKGLPVGTVKPGSAAAKVGIKSGDLVQAIGGVMINGSENYLKAWAKWEKATESDAVTFRIKRGIKSFVVNIIMRTVGGKFDHFVRKPVQN